MLYLVIEKFKDHAAAYQRYQAQGRMLPEGLEYLNSWVEDNFARCFQLMECDDPRLFKIWTARWDDLVDFEIVPVMTSAEATTRAMSDML
jgi:hypothetical protein